MLTVASVNKYVRCVDDHDVNACGAARSGSCVVDLQRRADHIRIIIGQAGDEGICIAHLDHHRTQDVRLADTFICVFAHHALALAQLVISLGIGFDGAQSAEG